MIVYRELSSLCEDLGVSQKLLYTLSNRISAHYSKVQIPKGNGEMRELSVPDGILKYVQSRIVKTILVHEEVSCYATAYRYGGSTVKNARVHVGRDAILKLDIRKFFDHVIYPMVKERVFRAEKYSEQNRVLLSVLCLYHDALPQGAPTSPHISNIILREFDNTVGEWCASRGIRYTRYCDDMTFSGEISPREVTAFVKAELRKLGLFLNPKKTVYAKRGMKQTVTGIVVNEKLNTPAEYRRKLRQELYYCKKFGVKSHLTHTGSTLEEGEYLAKLLGRLNYVLSVNAGDSEMQGYKTWVKKQLTSLR